MHFIQYSNLIQINPQRQQWIVLQSNDNIREKLEKQIPLFSDPEVGMVYGNVWLFFEKKNKKKIYRKGNLPTGKILNELLNDYVIGSPTYVVRKKSLESLTYCFNNDFHVFNIFTKFSNSN